MNRDAQQVAARAAALLGERIAALLQPGWQPLPHQTPPAGNWYGWLLLAGRGAGKTDACAHYVAEHVKGPPCISGPVPHWIGIIAPTLGDAATSCVNGPSGIKAHSPDARMVNRPGGLSVVWPNGSEAKLFGANTEEDTERLRSGGNRCCAAGTLVRTESGEVPIEDVRVGDQVWTRSGLRRVLQVWDNGVRPVQRYDHATGSTWLTPDHKVWTEERGWQQAQSVMTDDTVLSWDNTVKQSSTTVSGGTRTDEIPTTGTAGADSCTDGCGPEKSALSLTGCRCTTRTTTNETTGSTISRCCHPASTGPNTEQNAARTGTPRAAGHPMPNGCGRTSSATAVAARSGAEPTKAAGPGSVPTPAGTLHHEHGSSGCAACAARSMTPRSVSRPAPVHGSALRPWSQLSSESARVYDLTVEHDHEFFANGLLVSNCLAWLEELAAWRWQDAAWAQMRFGLRLGVRPHWIGSTTPKPRPLIKRLAKHEIADVTLSRASMYDNPHLPLHIRQALEDEYAGTQLGRQELMAELIDQDENALWTHEMIEHARWQYADLPDLKRITVGVDPSGGTGEQGIVVSGRAQLPRNDIDRRMLHHGFVLADRTVHLSPDQWARRAVQAAIDFEAQDIVVERNYGGQLAVSTIRSAADDMGIPIPIRTTWATQGKRVRAEPVAALTEQLRWHHAGTFPELEDQLCTWYSELDWSPDRLDAMVWTAWHNKVVHLPPGLAGKGLGRAAPRQIG